MGGVSERCGGIKCRGLILGVRLNTVISFVLLVSLHFRAPVLTQGGDMLLVAMLFWSLFLPLGALLADARNGLPSQRQLTTE